MLFNSIDFAIFLPVVFILYWFVTQQNLKLQNLFIVGASYLFYGWWDWRFLSLIFLSTIIDYFCGIGLKRYHDQSTRKLFLWTSILFNLSILGFFKYYNFFLENFTNAFSFFGQELDARPLNIILPVGISFYTFQTLSYTIDVYKRKLEPTEKIIDFAAFVSFFPQLVAGPIERATNLLPQFYKKRVFDYASAVDGLRQILWGFFKKMVIADNCAEYANLIFSTSDDHTGSTLLLGVTLFTFQIYGDFSGYSDIAIGTARLFGFNLMQNFAFPFFSRDIAEYWRRWHISLSTWFRDYVYIPLGGSKGGIKSKVKNTFIIFILSGFWHGANWTYLTWGFLNALYFLPLLLLNKNRSNLEVVAYGKTLPSLQEFLKILATFSFTVFAFIFFRANDLEHAFSYLNGIFSTSFFTVPSQYPGTVIILLIIFILIEWQGRENQYAIEKTAFNKPVWFRWGFYSLLILAIIIWGGQQQVFIYFQF